MADSKRMALSESVRKQGQKGGPLRYQLVAAAAKGPRHPPGRSEPASGAGRVAALTGNGAVRASQAGQRSPVADSRWRGGEHANATPLLPGQEPNKIPSPTTVQSFPVVAHASR
jgi:hypothetical protein